MPRKKPKRDKSKEMLWRNVLADKLASGLSQNEYCRQHGLNANNFSWWKREIARRDEQKFSQQVPVEPAPTFVQVAQPSEANLSPADSNSSNGMVIAEVDLAAGTLRIFAGINKQGLQEIFAALRESPA